MKTANNPYKVTIELPKEAVQHIVAPYEEALRDFASRNRALIDNAESEKIKKLESEISYLKKQLELSIVSLDSEKELKAYKKFCKKHEKCQLSSKENGGKVPYIILNGTGVGTCKKVICQVCGKKQDITDISVW